MPQISGFPRSSDTLQPGSTPFIKTSGVVGVFNVQDFGAKGDGVTDATTSIQAAINAAGPNSEVYFPAGQYLVTSQLSVTNNRVYLVGVGPQASVIVFQPTANGQVCLSVSILPVTGNIVQGGITGLTFFSNNSTFQKTAINITSVSSYFIRDVFVWGSVLSTYWSDTTNGSIALLINGHDLTTVNNFYAFADQPLVIAPPGIDMFNFTDCTFAARQNPCVYVRDNVSLTNINFLGRQDWSGGTYGFFWVNSVGSSTYYGLRFENIRVEQTTGSAGWCFYIGFVGQPVAVSAISRTAGVVTATVPAGSPFVVGKKVIIAGVTDTSYNGNFTIQSYNSATGVLTYNKGGGNSTSSGGTAAPSGGAACRLITFTNLYLSAGGINGFFFNSTFGVVLTNVVYVGTTVSLNIDTTSNNFIFWNVAFGFGGSTMSLGTPPFTDFICYNSAAGPTGGHLSIGTFDLTSFVNLPYQKAIAALNNAGVSKRLIGLGTDAGNSNLVDIDPDAIGLVTGGQVRIGGYLGPSAATTGVILPNNAPLLGANSTGTGTIPLIQAGTTNQIQIAPGGGGSVFGGGVQFGTAVIPNGAVAVITFGTTGGGGPTGAAQVGWQQFSDSTGTPFFVPVWR